MTRNNSRRLHAAYALVLTLITISAAHAENGRRGTSPTDQILSRLDSLQADIRSLQNDVAKVQRDVTTCTLAAKRNGDCDRVRSTTAQICFELDVIRAALVGEYKNELKGAFGGGASWHEGPYGEIKVEGSVPVGTPTSFGLEGETSVALNGSICVEVPIELLPATTVRTASLTSAVDEETQYEALATRFEEIAASVVPLLLDRIESRMPSGDGIVSAVQAFEDLGNGDLINRSGDLLSDPKLFQAVDIMPTPVILKTAIMNPGALRDRLPSMQGTARQRLATLCNPNTGLSIVRSPLFADFSGDVCSFLESVPEFNEMAPQLLDIPEATSALVDGMFNGTHQVEQNSSNGFCSKPIFANTRLCR